MADLDLAPLFALQSAPVYNPDFVNPPPSSPLVEFEDELAMMIATPAAQIAAEVRYAYGGAAAAAGARALRAASRRRRSKRSPS